MGYPTNIFKPGKLTIVLDGGAGSSAKGLRAANIWNNCRLPHAHTTFSVNTFMSNAAHTVTHEDGTENVYQCLSSITTLDYQKQYIGPGAVFAASEVLGEINKHGLTGEKLGIHPNAAIVTPLDIEYEKGTRDFEGKAKDTQESANLQIGSTLHGVGSARARRLLRRKDSINAGMISELKPFICKIDEEVLSRLQNGQSGLGEIAQGYQLSLYSQFWPRTTSRNCSVAAFLDDAMLPPSVAGPVVVNFRTCPIRVNNNKYLDKNGNILSWKQYNETPEGERRMIIGNSGGYYADQREMTWDEVSEQAGEKIFECTTLTGLPRRVFTFSKQSLLESLVHNNTGDDIYISINFMNYIDASVKDKRASTSISSIMTPKVCAWLKENVWSPKLVSQYMTKRLNVKGIFIGTGKTIDASVFLDISDLSNI